MTIRFPNRVGESGIYVDGTPPAITLSGSALMRLRTFSAAATGGALATNDTIGLAIEHATNPDIWQVWTATWTGTGLVAVAVEDQSGVLADGDSVEVRAVVTAATLDAAYAPTPALPSVWDGPDFWDIESSTATTWNATNAWYEHDADAYAQFRLLPTTSGSQLGWQGGFRPSSVSVELYLPVGFSSSTEYAGLRVYHGASLNEIWGDIVGSGQSEDTWVTLSCDLSVDLADDISGLRIVSIAANGDPPESDLYRLRNIVFTP